MDPLVREYLDSAFSHERHDEYHHGAWFDRRYEEFRVEDDRIQLVKLVPRHNGPVITPGGEFAYVDDNSRTQEQVDAMFRNLVMDFIHGKALKMREEERLNEYLDIMRQPAVSFSLRDAVEEIEARYDTRV